MRRQIAVIRALVEDVLMRLLSDVGQSTETISHPTVIIMIQTKVDQPVGKVLKGSAFDSAFNHTVYNMVFKSYLLDVIVTRTTDSPIFNVSAVMFVKNEV